MAWFVVRYQQDKYNLKENNKIYCDHGDIIKFGRVRFRIRKLSINYDEGDESSKFEDSDAMRDHLNKKYGPNSQNNQNNDDPLNNTDED